MTTGPGWAAENPGLRPVSFKSTLTLPVVGFTGLVRTSQPRHLAADNPYVVNDPYVVTASESTVARVVQGDM